MTLADTDAVWLRRWYQPLASSQLHPADSKFAQVESTEFMRSAVHLFDERERFWVNPLAAKLRAAEDASKGPGESQVDTTGTPTPLASESAAPTISSITVQFVTPDAAAVDAALGAVRGAPGVRGASTSSIAIGGTSVMRVTLAGDIIALAAALRGQGWQVSVGAGALRISR